MDGNVHDLSGLSSMDDELHQQCATQDATADDILEDQDTEDACDADDDVGSIDYLPPWYQQPQYSRFWQHYAAMQSWMQMYVMMYRNGSSRYPSIGYQHMMNRYDGYPCYSNSPYHSRHPFPERTPSHYPNWNCSSQRRVHEYGSHSPHYHSNATQKTRYRNDDSEHVDNVEKDDSNEEDMEVEISQEMLDFFKMSQKFREERDKAKVEAEKKAGAGKKKSKNPMRAEDTSNCKAPLERPDEGRRKGMKILYGKHSARIHSMETAMQMQFDRNCDRFQPAFWPIVALKM